MCGIYASFSSKNHQLISNQVLGCKNKNQLSRRGPDDTFTIQQKINTSKGRLYLDLSFYRLEINGANDTESQQPFHKDGIYLMCNGEIFNYRSLQEKHKTPHFRSDCKVILYLYFLFKGDFNKVIEELDGEFAMVLFDYSNRFHQEPKIFASRDYFGVRPLFFSLNETCVTFASEAKALTHLNNSIYPFPPKETRTYVLQPFYGQGGCGNTVSNSNQYTFVLKSINEKFVISSNKINNELVFSPNDKRNKFEEILAIHCVRVRGLLSKAVSKRISNRDHDVGIAFLLSGGLDSSLVCGIAKKLFKPERARMKTFSIGIIADDQKEPTEEQNPDLFYARKVAEFINSEHHEVVVKTSEALEIIPEVIKTIESYDTTTIRASVPMYLLCRYVKSHFPHIKVLLSGEGSDELFGGYLYFKGAPDNQSFIKERDYLLNNLYRYDNLRADRTVSANSLELRVPFLDYDLTKYVIENIEPEFLTHFVSVVGGDKKSPRIEKWLLRQSFGTEHVIPTEVLWRQKDAFSDAVGYNWKSEIGRFVSSKGITVDKTRSQEEEYYLQIYNEYYKDKIVFDKVEEGDYYWHPKWQPKELIDPSARELF